MQDFNYHLFAGFRPGKGGEAIRILLTDRVAAILEWDLKDKK